MKKIYSMLVMAAFTAMSASAVSMLGTYTHTYFDLKSFTEKTEEVSVFNQGDQTVLTLAGWPVPVTVDEEAGTLTLPTGVSLGYDESGAEVFFGLPTVNNGRVSIDVLRATPSVGTFADDKVPFSNDDIWAVYTLNDNKPSYLLVSDCNKLIDYVEGSADEWSYVGMATFQDGWIIPGYWSNTTSPSSWYKVELQQNSSNTNLYRLVNPYKVSDCPVAWLNICATDGYIEFDVTDPDYVVVNAVPAGFSEGNQLNYYCYNRAGWAMATLDITREAAKEAYSSQWASTFKEGVVCVGDMVEGEDGKKAWDACFGVNDDPYAHKCWQGTANMTTRIMFPTSSVESFDNEKTDEGSIEYFNLQGVRVAAPAPGQIVIKRQGNSVSKELIR